MRSRIVGALLVLCLCATLASSFLPLVVEYGLSQDSVQHRTQGSPLSIEQKADELTGECNNVATPMYSIVRCDDAPAVQFTPSQSSIDVQGMAQVIVDEIPSTVPAPSSPPIPGLLDPNITRVEWYNASSGNQTTWALPSTVVDIYITIKGPFSNGDQIRIDLRENVINGLDFTWDSGFYTFTSNLDENNTILLLWSGRTLDPAPLFGYGDQSLQVNRYFLELWKWETIIWVQKYSGSQDQATFLWMFGRFQFIQTKWLNSTIEWTYLAEPGWQVAPYTYFDIIDGPIANVDLVIGIYYDIALWPDEYITYDTVNITTTLLPGGYYIYWTGWFTVSPSRTYGNGFGQTRGLYDKVWRTFILPNTELYNGGSAGYELYVVSNIPNQPPSVSIIYPVDGEVIETSSAEAYCKIIDPNSAYDVSQVTLFLNGVPTDITGSYSASTQSASFTIVMPPSFTGFLNVTVQTEDGGGLKGSDTVFLLVFSPASVFPADYQSTELVISGSLLSHIFEWSETLTWAPDENYNVTIIPWVQFGFDLGSSIHMLYGLPDLVEAGDEFTALFKVTSFNLTLDLTFRMGFDFDFKAEGGFRFAGSMTYLDELYSISIPVELGIETYDLRFDIPVISPWIQSLTHFEIRASDIIPFPIGWLGDLWLTIDIVPVLSILKSLTCDITGSNVDVERSQLTWLGNDMIGVNCTVDPTINGDDIVQVDLTNFALQFQIGMSLGLELTLGGRILILELPPINMNEWMYDHLGIVIPTLDIWLDPVIFPLPGSANIPIPVDDKATFLDVTGISATELQIQVTIFLHDLSGVAVTGATVTGQIGATPYIASELGGGSYRFTLPYSASSFDLNIYATKSGHTTFSSIITIFVDPVTVDESPPQVSDVAHNPLAPEESQTVTVNATIVDALTGVKNASLYYSVDSGPWTRLTMSHTGNTFSATIPGQSSGVEVRYYIETFDNMGHRQTSSEESYTVEATTTTTGTTTPPPGISGFPTVAIALGIGTAIGIGIVSRNRRRKR